LYEFLIWPSVLHPSPSSCLDRYGDGRVVHRSA
jgi:hypothetical protein